MVIKKFIAKSLPEALTKVKKDFGNEAVILKTRFNNKPAAGQNSKIVEVTAAIDNNSVKGGNFKSQPVAREEIAAGQAEKGINRIKTEPAISAIEIPENKGKSKKTVQEPVNRMENTEKKPEGGHIPPGKNRVQSVENKPLPSEILGEIKDELSRMRSEVNKLTVSGESSKPYQARRDQLIDEIKQELSLLRKQNEDSVFAQPRIPILEYIRTLVGMHVPEEVALGIARKIPENIINNNKAETGWNSLIEILSELIAPGEPVKMAENGPTVVMLVGPTGSGKSSAAARMAFKYSLEKDCIVSLITTDTFRADSKGQLSSLANVIGCSFTATSSPQELAALMKTFKEGLVIIDTSGVSCPQDMEELASMVSAANPHEVHLVVPTDISTGDLTDFIKKYPEIGVDKVMVTKLDQTINRGGIMGAAIKLGLKFSFESASRELPGKFDLFNPVAFVSSAISVKEKTGPAKD